MCRLQQWERCWWRRMPVLMWRGCSARRAARSQAVNGPQLQGHVGQEDGSGPAPFWGDEQTAGGGLASPAPLWGKKKMDSESQDVDKCAESSLPQKPGEKEKRWSVHEADVALAVNLSVKCQWLWCWQRGSIIVPGKKPQRMASHVHARP